MDRLNEIADRIEAMLADGGIPERPEHYEAAMTRIRDHRQARGRAHWIGGEHPQYAHLLTCLVERLEARRVLELGVQSGASAYGLTCALPEAGLYVGIDNEGCEAADGGMTDFRALFGRPNQVFCLGEASRVLPCLAGSWDLIHFDHFKEFYLPDLYLLADLGQLRPDTVCLFHDSDTYAQSFMEELGRCFAHARDVSVPEGARLHWGFCRPAPAPPE